MAIETKMEYKKLTRVGLYCYWQNSWSNNHVWEIVCLFVTDRKLQAVNIFSFVFIVDLRLPVRIALLWFRACSSVQAPPLLASNSLRKESRNLKNCSFNLNNNKMDHTTFSYFFWKHEKVSELMLTAWDSSIVVPFISCLRLRFCCCVCVCVIVGHCSSCLKQKVSWSTTFVVNAILLNRTQTSLS